MILKKIKELCTAKGITIAKLEQELGIGNGTIGRWDESYPRVNYLKKVADYFGVSIECFFDEEGGENNDDTTEDQETVPEE